MLQESEIEQAARLVLATRGVHAEARAEKRISDLTLDGNDEAAQIWRRIADKITAIRMGSYGSTSLMGWPSSGERCD